MGLPVIVDVGIGLIIIYLSAALIISGIQEILAAIFQWRAKHLRESILQIMLDHEANPEELKKAKEMRDKLYHNPLIQSMNHTSVSWTTKLWNRLLFKSSDDYKKLYENCNPAYIDNKTFANALIDELRKDSLKTLLENPPTTENIEKRAKVIKEIKQKIEENKQIPKSLNKSLNALADRAVIKAKEGENILLSFQKEIEDWYDSSMDRASGIYKRNSQLVAWFLALVLVIFFNLDSLSLTQKLLDDSTLRDILADSGSTLVINSKTDPNDPNSQLDPDRLQANINELFSDTLPIIPLYEDSSNFVSCNKPDHCSLSSVFSHQGTINFKGLLLALIGWMVTTLAVFMGAPFWFQLLSKFVNIRSNGNIPKS